MKITGFTFIKNAIRYDYPIVEAIKSILPICNDFVVAVGDSEDDTEELIKKIAPSKIKIVKTTWDESLRQGGHVLADETNKAFKNIAKNSDWAFYIQGDEVIHEKYLDPIYKAMQHFKDTSTVDGLLFKYLHFFGSYNYVGNSSKWYKNEIRVIKNNPEIYSYRDAQGFRKGNNEKLNVVPIDACVYHYGWVKPPKVMQQKKENSNRYYHNDQWIEKNASDDDEFDYNKNIQSLKRFEGEHPKVIKKRIAEKNWEFTNDNFSEKQTLKDKIKMFFKRYLGLNFYYTNYRIIKIKGWNVTE